MNVDPGDSAGDAPLSPARHVTASHRMKLLPVDFFPSDDDVICGRGKKCYSHVGNDRFRQRVHGVLGLYRQARTKLDKSKVLNMVVEQVRQNSPGGGFVKQDESGRWYEVGDFLAREKTSQTFRDALHESYKSSSVSKKKRRQEELLKASDKTAAKIPRSSMDIAQKIKSMSLEMKNSAAKNQVYTQSQTNADIMAGIQQASRNMRHDTALRESLLHQHQQHQRQQQQLQQQQQQQFGGGFGAGQMAPNLNSSAPGGLHFEPDDMVGGNPQQQQFGNAQFGHASFRSMPTQMAQSFDEQFYASQNSSDRFSMDNSSEDLHHSVPSIQFDPERDLALGSGGGGGMGGGFGGGGGGERMHNSAPNLGNFSPAELLMSDDSNNNHSSSFHFSSSNIASSSAVPPMAVPSTIEFQMQQQQQQQLRQQQQGYLEDSPMRTSGRGSIVANLETLAQMRMEEDDNPFEPLPMMDQLDGSGGGGPMRNQAVVAGAPPGSMMFGGNAAGAAAAASSASAKQLLGEFPNMEQI